MGNRLPLRWRSRHEPAGNLQVQRGQKIRWSAMSDRIEVGFGLPEEALLLQRKRRRHW